MSHMGWAVSNQISSLDNVPPSQLAGKCKNLLEDPFTKHGCLSGTVLWHGVMKSENIFVEIKLAKSRDWLQDSL